MLTSISLLSVIVEDGPNSESATKQAAVVLLDAAVETAAKCEHYVDAPSGTRTRTSKTGEKKKT